MAQARKPTNSSSKNEEYRAPPARVVATSSRHSEGGQVTELNNELSGKTLMRSDKVMPMNLLSATNHQATSVKRLANQQQAAQSSDAALLAEQQVSSSRSSSTASDQRVLLRQSSALSSSTRNNKSDGPPTKQSINKSNMSPRVRAHKIACPFHKQQQHQVKRPSGLCSNHQHKMAVHLPQLVNNNLQNHRHHPQQQRQQSSPAHHHHHHHQSHCVHHPANQQRHHYVGAEAQHSHLRQQSFQANLVEEPFVVIERERRDREHHHHHQRQQQHINKDERRRRRRRATSDRDMARVIVHHQQQQKELHTSKRTTMRFISQLYFLIHLSAILSLLLHHKNLVTSETWRLQGGQQRQPPPTQSAAQDTLDPIIHLAKRHNNSSNNNNQNQTTTSQMPSHISQLPIPLILSASPVLSSHSVGTISSFVPTESALSADETVSAVRQHNRPIIGQQLGQLSRARRSLPQMLVTPATMGPLGGDILVRLFGYWHARWALHYFLAYLLCSSITMLLCLRLFRGRRSSKCSCHLSSSGWRLQDIKESESVDSKSSSTFGGFYYRTRLDCTPVLVGSISLGLIQLIVIGLDIASKVDWLSSSTNSSSGGGGKGSWLSSWPIYLPFLQFAFVSLLMQYILSKVAKNNNDQASLTSEMLHNNTGARMPINGDTTATKSQQQQSMLLLVHQENEPKSSGLITRRRPRRRRQHQMDQKHQHRHQMENNGKSSSSSRGRISGLQNIALAHLLVTHILLWLMKLNSISLFQAIDLHPLGHFAATSYSTYLPPRSRSSYLMPPSSPPPFQNNINELPKSSTGETAPPASHEDTNAASRLRPTSTLSSSSSSSPPPRSELDRMEREINRSEREFNRTELERILRTARPPPSRMLVAPPVVKLNNISGSPLQVLTGGQYRRPTSITQESVANISHQRSLAGGFQTEQHQSTKSERDLRSATRMERPTVADNNKHNDSIVMSRAELANLIQLASKNNVLVMPTTTTSTSTTTARPQFKSSLPKRMTAFRQVHRPTVLLNRTLLTTTTSTSTPTTTTTMPTASTTTTSSTTSRMPPDLTKIISLAPQQPVKIHFSREGDENNELELATPAGVLELDDYYHDPTTTGPPQDQADNESFSTERPFPSVESDPPPRGAAVPTYTDAEQEPTSSPMDHQQQQQQNHQDGADNATADESEELDLDSFLPPVPNYNHENNNETNNEEPDEQSSHISLAFVGLHSDNLTEGNYRINTPITPRREALVMRGFEDELTASTNHDQQQPTFSDYLLPIVYQYHILIIAILFNMWLDSLRTSSRSSISSPLITADRVVQKSTRRHSASSNSSSPSSHLGQQQRVRSRSVESDLAGLGGRHRDRHRNHQNYASQDQPTLSRSNSLRASNEQLLWVSGGRQRHRQAGRREPGDWDSASLDSSLTLSASSSLSRSSRQPIRIGIVHQEEPPTSSACSVFFGLLIVSAGLIVILLGVELLTILNQCATQLLSILVCLVGLCLVWRSQSQIANKHRQRMAHHHRQNKQQQQQPSEQGKRRLLLSRKGAAYLTNPHDIVLSSAKMQANDIRSQVDLQSEPAAQEATSSSGNHRQCFHYLFLLAAYFCGVSIALNLGKQHSIQQLFPAHIMQFLQRQWLHRPNSSNINNNIHQQTTSATATKEGLFQNWGLFWSSELNNESPPLTIGQSYEPTLSPMVLFHVVLASKGLLLILQVTLQTILIRSSCSQRATRQLRQVYTFLMFSNLSLWAMDICEQQQHLQRHDSSSSINLMQMSDSRQMDHQQKHPGASVVDVRLITLDGFTQFASSIVTLSHLYHGLVFMQH